MRVNSEPLAAVAQLQNQSDQDHEGCCQKGDSNRELPVLLVLRRSDHCGGRGWESLSHPRLIHASCSWQFSSFCRAFQIPTTQLEVPVCHQHRHPKKGGSHPVYLTHSPTSVGQHLNHRFVPLHNQREKCLRPYALPTITSRLAVS